MGTNSFQNRRPEQINQSEVIDNPESHERFSTQQRASLQRAALGHSMENDDVRNAAVEGMAERANNRSPEEVHAAMQSVLTQERLAELNLSGVQLWRSNGHSIMRTDRGYSESSGDNEMLRLKDIYKRLVMTSRWGLRNHSGKKSYMGIYGKKYVIDRSLLENDLVYVSDPKRSVVPEGTDPEKTEPFRRRAELFGKYRTILLDLLHAVQSPEDEQAFVSRNGSVASEQLLERHCNKNETAKGAVKVLALGVAGLLLIGNAINDFRNGKPSLYTLALVGAIALLVGKHSKLQPLANSDFTKFSRERLPRDKAAKIMGLPPQRRNALLRYFKKHPAETMTAERLERVINPKNSKGKPLLNRAVPEDIARIFEGMKGATAFNHLNAIVTMGKTKDRDMVLDFLDANYQDGGQTEQDMRDIANSTTPSSSTP